MESAKGSENGNQESEYAKANENGEQGIESANEKGEQGTESANENGEQVTESAPNPSPHTLDLDQPKKPGLYKCKGCNQFGANKRYKCRSCDNLILHEVCANSPDEGVHNRAHLQFRRRKICLHSCNACKESLRGFMFESSSPKLRLHPLCMMLPETFTYSGHRHHNLKLVRDESGNKYKCTQCHEEYSGWRYRCVETDCEVILDLNCCIIDIHDLSGITKVASRSRFRHILKKGFNCSTLIEGFCGTGSIIAGVAGGAVDCITGGSGEETNR